MPLNLSCTNVQVHLDTLVIFNGAGLLVPLFINFCSVLKNCSLLYLVLSNTLYIVRKEL